MLRQRRSRGNGHGPRSAPAARNGRPVELSDDELAVVLAACRRYRQSIPIYLESSQPELQLIRAVIRKLS
jgi:hypothetical protein